MIFQQHLSLAYCTLLFKYQRSFNEIRSVAIYINIKAFIRVNRMLTEDDSQWRNWVILGQMRLKDFWAYIQWHELRTF